MRPERANERAQRAQGGASGDEGDGDQHEESDGDEHPPESYHRDSPTARRRYRVGPSPIAGLGIFAAVPIARGEWVVEYQGERITDEECERRSVDWTPGQVCHTVFFEVSAELVIDGAVGGNSARFINHSCDPTCLVEIEDDRVHVYARRNLLPGDELTFDYGYRWEARFPVAMRNAYPCNCGSPTCRGTMFADLPPI